MSPPVPEYEPPSSGKNAGAGGTIPSQKTVKQQLANKSMTVAIRLPKYQPQTWIQTISKIVKDTILKMLMAMLRLGLEHLMWACCRLMVLDVTSWIFF
jgi:hypothetical protein